jgi:hypothetical protein
MRPLIILAVALAVTGCASRSAVAPDRVSVQTVDVPVAQPCKVDVGPAPAYPDTVAAIEGAPDIFERAKLYAAGRLMRISREIVLEAAISACQAPPK